MLAQEKEKEFWNKRLYNRSRNPETSKLFFLEYINFIKRYIDFKSSDRILDIGCGPYGLINYIDTGERYGLDPLIDYYLSIYEMPKDMINYVKGCGEDIPFRDSVFDAIICTNTLDHTRDPEKTLKEINRVLREEGILIITVNCYSFIHKLFRIIMERVGRGDIAHPFSFTSKQVKKMLEGTGFNVITMVSNLLYDSYKRLGLNINPKRSWKGIIYSKTLFKIEKQFDKDLLQDVYMKEILVIAKKLIRARR